MREETKQPKHIIAAAAVPVEVSASEQPLTCWKRQHYQEYSLRFGILVLHNNQRYATVSAPFTHWSVHKHIHIHIIDCKCYFQMTCACRAHMYISLFFVHQHTHTEMFFCFSFPVLSSSFDREKCCYRNRWSKRAKDQTSKRTTTGNEHTAIAEIQRERGKWTKRREKKWRK